MRAAASDLPIRFDAVTLRNGAVTMLERVTLQIEAGAPTVLIGPNGSGKTTFLRAAMGLIAPSAGGVTWGGAESVPPLRRAFVFQRPAMLRRSAQGNLRYALFAAQVPRARHDARIKELLALVGLVDLGRRPARRLSGGEQQRLALPRPPAPGADVLFLDEPTASLDPAATKAIEDIIRAIAASGIKVVMSTHDLGEAKRLAGDILLLHRGRIVERAPVSEFLNAPRTAEART